MARLPKNIKPKIKLFESHTHNHCLDCGYNYDLGYGECPNCLSRRRRANI